MEVRSGTLFGCRFEPLPPSRLSSWRWLWRRLLRPRRRVPRRLRAAVITGTSGRVAPVKASGDDAASSSATQDAEGHRAGRRLRVGRRRRSSASCRLRRRPRRTTSRCFGGAVQASLVSRSAEATGEGREVQRERARARRGDKEGSGRCPGSKTYSCDDGKVVVNEDGAGLIVTLTHDVGGYAGGHARWSSPTCRRRAAGGSVADRVADRDGDGHGDPEGHRDADGHAEPAAPKPPPSYKTRLMTQELGLPGRPARRRSAGRSAPPAPTPARTRATTSSPTSARRSWRSPTGRSRTSARCRSPATACGSTPTAATSSSTRISRPSRPRPSTTRGCEAGTILGYVGNTGDAEPTPPHLHFEIHPDGGKAVDPNPFLVAWQKRAGTSSSDTAERPGALVEVRDFIGEG